MFDAPPPVDRAGLKRWIAERFADVPFIDGAALAAWLADASRPAPVIVDVRSRLERSVSMLPGAIGADDGPAAVAAVASLDPAAPIVAYCAGGLRSARVARKLIEAGHRNVNNLEGGIFAWANDGRPLVVGGQPTRHAHPVDAKWSVMLDADRHAWKPSAPG